MVGLRLVAAAVALVALAFPVNASFVESTSNGIVSYQFDADNHHDAPDACADAGPAWSLAIGNSTDGMLVPPDDNSDVFQLNVPADAVGSRIRVRVSEQPGSPQLAVNAFAPLCIGDVFAPQNHPSQRPQPPAPAAGEATFNLESPPDPRYCNGSVWTFGVSGLQNTTAPATIYVAWTDASRGLASLRGQGYGFAVYETDQSLAYTLEGAWINLPADWSGRFVVVRGPCDAVDGGAVYGDPPTLTSGVLSFTPIRAGPHLVQITLDESATPSVPTAVTMSCHYCLGPEVGEALEKIGYFLRADIVAS